MRVFENPLHPALLRLESDAISAEALDAALAAHPNRGFICTIEESDTRAAALLSSSGFSLARRTIEGRWQGEPSAPLPDLEHGTLAQRPDLTTPWLAAHKQHYFATHRANPPAELDTARWDGVFLGKDFRPESAFFILDDGHIAAFSSLRPSSEGWELAWFGTTPENHPEIAVLNAGLVAMETAFMVANSIPSALIEWDSPNPDALWRIRHFPLHNPIIYWTFLRTM